MSGFLKVFEAPPGYLAYGNLIHTMQRTKKCDVCNLDMVGTPRQKRHIECAKKEAPKLNRRHKIRRLVNAPIVSVGSKWKQRDQFFECTEIDGLYVKGLWSRSEKKSWKSRISRATLYKKWIPLN